MSEKKKILVVEDELDLAEMLSTYFRAEGYSVTSVSWGEDAVEATEEKMPDLITLDINLPDIDGYEVCRRIRKIRRAEHVPVIFLTEKRKRKDKLAGLELGAVDYITKPFDIQELSLRVGNTLRRSKLKTMGNPITNLPEGRIVQEKLEEMLVQPEWAVIVAGFEGLEDFRDTYGFVAADDIVRAAGLMINKALEASQANWDFLGHIDNGYFLILTDPDQANKIAENCLVRLETSIPYFYPVFDRVIGDSSVGDEGLSTRITVLRSKDGPINTLNELRKALIQAADFQTLDSIPPP